MEGKLSYEMLEALVETQEKIDKLDIIGILEFLVKQITKTLKVKRCAIFRVFTEIETLRLVIGEPKDGHGLGMKFSFNDLKALQETVESKSFILIEDPAHDPRTENSRDKIRDEEINTILLVPLVVAGEVYGIISVDATKSKKGFSGEEIQFCLILANLAILLLERDLSEKEKMEKKTLLMLGETAAEAVHRLRNPVITITNFARRLMKIAGDISSADKCKEYAKMIFESALDLEKIGNSLLSFSRPKKAKIEGVSVNETILKVCHSLDDLREKKNIKFGFSLDPQLPLLMADSKDIEEVVFPILWNAVEAIKNGGEIRTKTKLENGYLKIFISNNGGCVDEEILKEIFNPFFTTKPDGLGLGLAIANSTANAYGGDIRVENTEPLGVTTFAIRFPLDHRQEGGKLCFAEHSNPVLMEKAG